jgi:hypothetical protein
MHPQKPALPLGSSELREVQGSTGVRQAAGERAAPPLPGLALPARAPPPGGWPWP